MKKLIAVGVASALVFAMPRPANALFGVGDVVFDPSSYGELVQQAKSGLETVKSLGQIYTVGRQQYQSLVNIYEMFAHITDLGQILPILNTLGINEPMLNDALHLEQILRGNGFQSNLVGRITQMVNLTRHYAPQGNDYRANHMNMGSQAIAGQLAAGQYAYDAGASRAMALNALKDQLNTNDPAAVMATNARAAIEAAQGNAAIAQTNAAIMMQNAQIALDQQQAEQADRASADSLAAAAQRAAELSSTGQLSLLTQ